MEQMMLERLGYQVTIRMSSPDALAAFKANPGNRERKLPSEEKGVLFGPAVDVPQFDSRRPFPAPSKGRNDIAPIGRDIASRTV